MSKQMYCIMHEKMEMVENGPLGKVHLVMEFDPLVGLDWCEGPFAYCPPPDEPIDAYFDHLFDDEDAIWAYLDWVRQMEDGNENAS